jgi:hypothetical protein
MPDGYINIILKGIKETESIETVQILRDEAYGNHLFKSIICYKCRRL